MWQEIAAGIVILGSLYYLMKRFFGKKASGSGCESCGPVTDKKA